MSNIIAPSRHSNIVGGSTATRVIACPGCVKLCQQVPKPPSSSYAEEGSALHAAIAEIIHDNLTPETFEGKVYGGVELTSELLGNKLIPAVNAFDRYLDEIETEQNQHSDVLVEQEVSYESIIPGVFGSCDVLIKTGNVVSVLDFKFGFHEVSPEENAQLYFYAGAAMLTEATAKLFHGVERVELVIIQPMSKEPLKRWSTTVASVNTFTQVLKAAVEQSEKDDAPFLQGDHCTWCNGKPLCPLMNGAVSKALSIDLQQTEIEKLGLALEQAELLEGWIHELRSLAHRAIEGGINVPGWKLVGKRGTREWLDIPKASKEIEHALFEAMHDFPRCDIDRVLYKSEFRSPAQMEKTLKSLRVKMPENLTATVSRGFTLAKADDPRPAATLETAPHEALAEALKTISK